MNRFLSILLFAVALVLAACQDVTETVNPGGGKEDDPEAMETKIDYPTKDIQVFVGHGAGGGTDTFVRQITKLMEKDLGVKFNVINMEGAGGVIAKEKAANEPADGYTIVGGGALPIQVAVGTNKNAHLNVFKAVARVQSDTAALQVKAGTYPSIEAFIEEAKANPGQLRIGGTGVGIIDDIIVRMFKRATGLDVIYVPFEGAGDMHAALLGGHIEAMIEEPGPTLSQIEAGEIEPILFFAEERIDEFPDVPTSVEKGWEITYGVERGFYIRKDTPQEIVDTLEAAVKRAYDSDEYKEYERNAFLHLREGWLSSEEYTEKMKRDIEVFSEIIASTE